MKQCIHFGLLLLGLVAGGCANVNVQRPSVAVEGMSVGEVDASGFTMLFDVAVENPNSVALPLADVDYKLGVGGVELADGEASPKDGEVGANERKSIRLPVNVTFENLLRAEEAIRRGGGSIPYSLDATMGFRAGSVPLMSGPITVPLKYNGNLNVRELVKDPMVLLRSSAARKLAERALGGLLGS